MLSEWNNNQPLLLECVDKWQETADTVSVKLINPQSPQTAFIFKPGQFISIGVLLNGKMEYRAYSISSMPGECSLQLTIKLVPNGLVSSYLVEQLSVGEQLSVLAPTGPFNHIDCVAKPKVLLLSAGCGITPVMSMAKTWLRDQAPVNITFVHMARSAQQTIYLQQLEQLAKQHANFNLQLLLKDNSGTRHAQGRLDKHWLQTLCPDIAERTVYLCGPTQFMQDMAKFADELGVPMEHFFQESFTPAETEPQLAVSGAVQLEVPAFGITKEVAQGTVLADALEQSGVPIIIACRSGICGSCKCQVTKGEFTRTSTETLTDAEIEQGYTLACSSQIDSDVEVVL